MKKFCDPGLASCGSTNPNPLLVDIEGEQISCMGGRYEPDLDVANMPTLMSLAQIQSRESNLAAREAGRYHIATCFGGKENSLKISSLVDATVEKLKVNISLTQAP